MLEEVIKLSGLPKNEVIEDIENILRQKGICRKNMSLEEVREIVATYARKSMSIYLRNKKNFIVHCIGAIIFIIGCAELPQHTNIEDHKSMRTTLKTPSSKTEFSHIEKYGISDFIKVEEPNTYTVYDDSRYDFPITINTRVEGWIDYFTGKGQAHMERYLGRSSKYIPVMKKILKKHGIPEDLVYLALIESGFNFKAHSRARAVGPWQFVRETGRRYGLRVDAWIDERRDPILSTEAAAKYLKDLYLMFESWYLAAAAYNAGEFKILRAIEALKNNNYWRICQSRFVKRETKDYVPKLIAAAIIAKNPAKYGFGYVQYQEPFEFETVQVDFPIHLKEVAKLINEPIEVLEELNPVLRRQIVPPDLGNFELRIPVGSKTLVERAIATVKTKLTATEIPHEHVVKKGETLNTIARKYGLARRYLANANNLSPKSKLEPGMKLIIPKYSRKLLSVRSTETHKGYSFHKVKPNETLWSIAVKYDVTIQDIFRWNNLRNSKIYPGMIIKYISKSRKVSREVDSKKLSIYIVKRGDTLWDIAQEYGVMIDDIRKWNNLGNASRITPGTKLKIKAD